MRRRSPARGRRGPRRAFHAGPYTRLLALAILLSLLAALAAGCSKVPTPPSGLEADDRPSIVCTTFPQYDWTVRILGEAADSFRLTLLNRQGADMHSFEPTAPDMLSLSDCDLFICIGGFSENWVPAALQAADNPDATVLYLLDVVDALQEAALPGLAEDEHHDHEHGHGEEAEDEEMDEHLWLSLRRAAQACEAIAQAISTLDPDRAPLYRQNLQAYLDNLEALDLRYTEAVQAASQDASPAPFLLIADRFPFLYLTTDYDLPYAAAFSGCEADSAAGFDTVLYLAEEMRAHRPPAILILEGSDPALAETVLRTADCEAEILHLNSLQSVPARTIDDGFTYLGAMEENLRVLRTAMGLP